MVELETTFSGARTRVSQHINRKPASNIYHAIRIAEAIGASLNTYVTINFTETDCAPETASFRWQRLRRHFFAPWARRPPRRLKRRADKCAYVWTLENSGALALHWLVHIPPDRLTEFKSCLPAWLANVGARPLHTSTIDINDKPYSMRGLGRYILKGINPVYAPTLGIEHRPQGLVHGQRSGFSRSLGPSVKAALREVGRYPRRRYCVWPSPSP
jgi:hypothetical protein